MSNRSSGRRSFSLSFSVSPTYYRTERLLLSCIKRERELQLPSLLQSQRRPWMKRLYFSAQNLDVNRHLGIFMTACRHLDRRRQFPTRARSECMAIILHFHFSNNKAEHGLYYHWCAIIVTKHWCAINLLTGNINKEIYAEKYKGKGEGYIYGNITPKFERVTFSKDYSTGMQEWKKILCRLEPAYSPSSFATDRIIFVSYSTIKI